MPFSNYFTGAGLAPVDLSTPVFQGDSLPTNVSVFDNGDLFFVRSTGELYVNNNGTWEQLDGTALGEINADLLQGEDGNYYLNWNNTTNKPSPTITFSGDVSGSVTLTDLTSQSVSVTVLDDSHNHIINNVDGLQTALDGKVDENSAITGGTSTKVTYDTKGLVTSGTNISASDIPSLDASIITTGEFADARISSSSVIQHEAALTVSSSQVSDFVSASRAAMDKATIDALNVDADTLDGQDGSYYVDFTNATNVPDPQLTLTGDVTGSATLTDLGSASLSASVTEGAVTQHEAALTISSSQVSDFTSATQTIVSDTYVESLGVNADSLDYSNSGSGLLASNVQAAIDELQAEKASVGLLSSNIILYPTSALSTVSGFYKLVTSVDDPDYNSTAVNFSTGTISSDDQVVGSLISEPGIIEGNPGVINISTVGNIRRVSGNKTASFYFRVFKRDSGGVEELLAESEPTPEVTSSTYRQFGEAALLNNGAFLSTDRIVIRFYGSPTGTGNNPVYQFQIGGTDPVRTLLPVPVEVVPSDDASDIQVDTSAFGGVLSGSDSTVQAALDTVDDHQHTESDITDLDKYTQAQVDAKDDAVEAAAVAFAIALG